MLLKTKKITELLQANEAATAELEKAKGERDALRVGLQKMVKNYTDALDQRDYAISRADAAELPQARPQDIQIKFAALAPKPCWWQFWKRGA